MSGIMRDQPFASRGLLASYKAIKNIFHAGIELIFPPQCAGCNRIDTYWCDTCQQELDNIPVTNKLTHLHKLDVASTNLHTGKLREAVHALKYGGVQSLSISLAKRMIQRLESTKWDFDIIIPIPLHESRLKLRGYNQSELLGNIITCDLHLRCIPEAVNRCKNTLAQVELTPAERFHNVQDAFQADSLWVQNKSILLIDDVLTTGATMSACASSLTEAGAHKIYGLTVTSAN